jgi:hypothetical protein
MNDFAFVAIMLAFFVLAALFVAGCDRIIGPDEQALGGPTQDVEEAEDGERAAA